MTKEMVAGFNLSPDAIQILKKTVCIDHTDEQVKFFAIYCTSKGLDPFGKEIHSIIRKGKQTFQTGIDALRSMAEDTNEYDGTQIFWCAQSGEWGDAWLSDTPPYAAKAIVWKKNVKYPFVAIAKYSEYKPDEDWMWKKMPSNQLAKCAEALGLRKAFPRKLANIYSNEEMEQADIPQEKIKTPQAKKSVSTMKDIPVDEDIVESEPIEEPIPWPESAPTIEAPKVTESSKFLGRLQQIAREKGLSPEKMKASMQILFSKDSSKLLTDEECSKLIKQIENGAIRSS